MFLPASKLLLKQFVTFQTLLFSLARPNRYSAGIPPLVPDTITPQVIPAWYMLLPSERFSTNYVNHLSTYELTEYKNTLNNRPFTIRPSDKTLLFSLLVLSINLEYTRTHQLEVGR